MGARTAAHEYLCVALAALVCDTTTPRHLHMRKAGEGGKDLFFGSLNLGGVAALSVGPTRRARVLVLRAPM